MAKVFVTGPSQGLGLMTGRAPGRAGTRGRAPRQERGAGPGCPGSAAAGRGGAGRRRLDDRRLRDVAAQANEQGRFDAVVHNVGIGYREPRRVETADGLSQLRAVNVLAPYMRGNPVLDDPQFSVRRWSGSQADSKLLDLLLAFAAARRRPGVASNAVSPGWVQTRMGGAGAPGDLDQADLTRARLAVGDDPETRETGGVFYHRRPADVHPAARDPELRDRLLYYCRDVSGVALEESGTRPRSAPRTQRR